MKSSTLEGVDVLGVVEKSVREILAPDALAFVARLEREFGDRRRALLRRRLEREVGDRRRALLRRRLERQAAFDGGLLPGFLPTTRKIRNDPWRIAPPPRDLLDRRVEITGPVDAKTIVNGLNSAELGARVF